MNMKIIKALTALILCMVLSVIMVTTAFAGWTVSNPFITPKINGYQYSLTSEVAKRYPDLTSSTAEAIARIRYDGAGNVPQGYMGAHARLFTSTGTLWCSGTITYNDTRVSTHFAYSPATKKAGQYYAQCRGYFYNGDGYDAYTGYKSPMLAITTSSSASASIIKDAENALNEIRSRTSYEKNENGETYGSALSAETIGYEPDLIAAIGTNGIEGYVRSSDLDTGVTSPEEAIAYMNNLGDSIVIPLYDVNGTTVLGEFMLETVLEVH